MRFLYNLSIYLYIFFIRVVSLFNAKAKLMIAGRKNIFENTSDKKLKIAPEELWYPRASSLIRIFKNSPNTVKKLLSSDDFLPSYLRQSEPEERRDEKVSPEL